MHYYVNVVTITHGKALISDHIRQSQSENEYSCRAHIATYYTLFSCQLTFPVSGG